MTETPLPAVPALSRDEAETALTADTEALASMLRDLGRKVIARYRTGTICLSGTNQFLHECGLPSVDASSSRSAASLASPADAGITLPDLAIYSAEGIQMLAKEARTALENRRDMLRSLLLEPRWAPYIEGSVRQKFFDAHGMRPARQTIELSVRMTVVVTGTADGMLTKARLAGIKRKMTEAAEDLPALKRAAALLGDAVPHVVVSTAQHVTGAV